ATAALAVDLCASREQALVDAGGYRIFEGCIEARPAGAAVELGLRREQGKIAPRAQVGAGRILLVKGAAPGALRAVFAQDVELLAGGVFAPLLLALGDLECVARRTLGASACGLEKGAEHGDGESGQGQPAAIHHCCLLLVAFDRGTLFTPTAKSLAKLLSCALVYRPHSFQSVPQRRCALTAQRPAYRCTSTRSHLITAIKVRKDSTFLTSGEQWCSAVAMITTRRQSFNFERHRDR